MRHSDPGSRLISFYGCNMFQQQPAESITLEAFLKGVQCGQWKKQVEDVRVLIDPEQIKAAKKQVPAVSPSCIFTGKHSGANVKEHTGILCLDLDGKANPGIAQPAARARVYADQYTFAGHVSVSGSGICLYVQIEPEQHEAAFLQLEQYFLAAWGVHVDPACKDVSRLRFVSYDPALYRNHEARPFIAKKKRFNTDRQQVRRSVDRAAVQDSGQYFEAVLSQILAAGYDLTGSYYDWVKIGFALAEGYNEAGRQYFHEISKFHPKYKPAETDRQFTRCLQTRPARIGRKTIKLSTFFYMAKQAGFTFKQQ